MSHTNVNIVTSTTKDQKITDYQQAEKQICQQDKVSFSDNELNTIALRANLIRPVFDELCNSITVSLSSTTEPISNELLRIKSTAASFLNEMKEYEGEVNGHATLLRIETESKGFKSDMDALSEIVRRAFNTLENQFTQLKTVSNKIADVAKNIATVSANIHVLSINASIEAARTGEAGKGFRVIASEVKTLSGQTERHLGEINTTMDQTQDIFRKIGECLSENKLTVVELVDKKKNRFGDFALTLNEYFEKFESLYSGVEKVIGSLSKGMDVISPVIQLHEITSQEIGNLRLVADDFTALLTKAGKAETQKSDIEKQAREIAAEVRKRVTTERELLALKRGLETMVSNLDFNLAINNSDIELF